MKFKRLVIISFLFISIQTLAQYHTPQSPIMIPKSNLDKSSLIEILNSTRALFTPIEIDELRLAIRKSNNAVDNEISLIKSHMSNRFMDKQELLQLKDIKQINEVIREKERNRKAIEEQIKNDLSNINFKGLFIVVLKEIDPWASKQQLADQAEITLAPRAIEDLNGVFVSSMTQVENSVLISDKIKSIISGEMSIEKQYISRTIDNRTKFLYVVKVNVAPLKKAVKTETTSLGEKENVLILNAMTEEAASQLAAFGVSQDEVTKVNFEVESTRQSIDLANATASRREMDILRNGNTNIGKIDKEIETLKNSLTNRSGTLKRIIEEKTDVTFDPNRPDESINAALAFLDKELDNLKSQLISIKEKELIARYAVSVTAEGTPAEDIAKTAVNIAGQIEQSYSRIEQFMEETTSENFMLKDVQRGQQKDVYRKLDTVWLYPVAGDQDNFLLTVVVQFNITDVKNPAVGQRTESFRQKDEKFGTMTDIDGNVYKTVRIGNQVWMAENLRVTRYRNGVEIPKVTDNNEWTGLKYGAYCVQNNDETNTDAYGYLYNWHVISHEGNIAPEGWHVPSEEEWQIFEKALGRNQTDIDKDTGLRGENTGGKLKETGSQYWKESTGAIDEFGFAARPGGSRGGYPSGLYTGMGYYARFWTATTSGTGEYNRWHRELSYNRGAMYRNDMYGMTSGMSIRLVKDSETTTRSEVKNKYGTAKDIDGNIYRTVKIGNQTWMIDNLKVTRYRNGDPIPKITSDSDWARLNNHAYCAYNNSEGTARNYGYLYNWYAAVDSRNIAPQGWHVPTDEEWKELERHIGFSPEEADDYAYRGTDQGGKLKEMGFRSWDSPNKGATNESRFSALPAGYRHWENGMFGYIRTRAYFWSSTEDNFNNVWCRVLRINESGVIRPQEKKHCGMSIRLVKD